METRVDWSNLTAEHFGLLMATVRMHLPSEPLRVLRHAHTLYHTLYTEEKQALLPKGVAVQKSFTVSYSAGPLLLVSGIGNFHLSRQGLRAIASSLGLPARMARQSTINPSTHPAEAVSGLPFGMVSPFLPPPSPDLAPSFSAVVVLEPGEEAARVDTVAVSLSLASSLLLPARALTDILKAYALRVYPTIPLLVLPAPSLSQPKPAAGKLPAAGRSCDKVLIGVG